MAAARRQSRRRAPTTTLELSSLSPALLDLVMDGFALLKPVVNLTVSEWADQYRKLSREDSAEVGQYRTARFEPLREIMDAATNTAVREVVCQKGSQVGWTTLCTNLIGYYMHHDPGPIMLIQPTLDMASAYSRDRLAPMLRDTPCLTNLVKSPRARDSGNTILHKKFAGGHLAIIGANSPASLASRPMRIVIADEVDRYPVSAGSEGDPLKLASKRQVTFWNARTFSGSTPVFAGGAISRLYEKSDCRRYLARCPHCLDAYQEVIWAQVKFSREDGKLVRDSVGYQCIECGVLWDDVDRIEAVNSGRWEATKEFEGVAGFFLPQLLSPWVTLADVVAEFLEAKDNPELLQVWTNTVLAEGWREQGERLDDAGLMDRAEGYGPNDLPEAVVVATAGVDTQDDRLEVQIIGWGVGEESWPIAYHVIVGSPAEGAVWRELDELLKSRFTTRTGRLVRVRAACIDMLGHHTDAVLKFCKGKTRRRIWAIAGKDGPRPIWPVRASKNKNKIPFRSIGVDTAKDRIYSRLRIEAPPDGAEAGKPGFVHFPLHEVIEGRDNGFGAEYFEQLTSEEVRTKMVQGRPKRFWFKPPGARNEALDTFVYALAARESLAKDLRHYLDRARPSPVQQREPEFAPEIGKPAAAVRAAGRSGRSFVKRRGSGPWMRRR